MERAMHGFALATLVALGSSANGQSLTFEAKEPAAISIMRSGGDSTRVSALLDHRLLSRDQLPSIDPVRISSPYSYERLGIFCKAEVKMNRWFPIPVMIRMGDVEQAEALDGKGTFRTTH